MKKILRYTTVLFVGILMYSCYDGIDPITAVDPGQDEGAPIVTIVKPTEGLAISDPNPTSSVDIELEAEDDIELALVTVSVDGNQIASYDEFTDYRIVTRELTYDNVTIGDHVVSVSATDIVGNTTTVTANFTKEPPYVPLYEGEMLYMPFDGDYTNLVNSMPATTVGSPGFAGESYAGNNAYAGATDSYLTVPTEGLLSSQFTASFWYKVDANPNRAGILTVGPPDEDNPDAQNNRTSGFRFFREDAGGMQRFKLNVGTGDGESWFDGGSAADVDPTTNEWIHLAFTISESEAVVYINGNVVSQNSFAGVDWTGCDILSIMSGAPRFTGWNHLSDLSYMDELRIFNVALSQSEIVEQMAYSSQILYMPFNGSYTDIVNDVDATEEGTPGFTGSADAYMGNNAYAGATDSYLTVPTDMLNLGSDLSATFWMNINADPDRAGILVIGPPDEDNPDAQNNRTSGFRFFRENAGGMQRFKLNVGNGTADSWFDGGTAADVDPSTTDWVHFAFTISDSAVVVYINGNIVSQGSVSGGVDWTGCDILSIMSGAPRFTGWNHWSDLSYMDELRLYNKALSQEEVQSML
ncbi:LamG domain-containing protein [Mangrovimonas sp. AS39]|uniref:LamG domain-containing protein n=1 Tax=Mangrovimonas futianensis TaxID=2895523 RepID=UPI001E2D6E5B|nr:LamG domain-containing protein [Mangrovimonas futianensis]MCF1190053.1 LamG domain-containing protein [Mangrovimonas futianensis]MCF1194196.1 LamG domain-containing protein [Mangrovimonas futianensis]